MAAIFTYALLNGETFIFKEKSDVSMNIFNNITVRLKID